jgi:hypothetical protein
MKPLIFGKWHFWQAVGGFFLSDEDKKELRRFSSIDGAVNFLFFEDREAARYINKAAKGQA